MRKAVIDLGTNTFNLLIADVTGNEMKILYSDKQAAKLGEGSINEFIISSEAMDRGLNILKEYKKEIKQYGVEDIQAIATSAVRSAKNGAFFVSKIKEETNISVEVISGLKEAQFIFEGVQQIYKEESNFVILDIGGGSTEFIVVEDGKVVDLKSFDLGIARLIEKFKPSNPITTKEFDAVYDYLKTELTPFFSTIKRKSIQTLIGSSGSFDTIVSLMSHRFFNPVDFQNKLSSPISNTHFEAIYESLLNSTISERRAMLGMDLIRVEMMVLAIIFIKFVKEELNIDNVLQSRYALKEGVLFR